MKDLVDRYLAAVSRQLPEKQRADINAELRDLLLSQVEAKEEALGRPLALDETESLLKEFGHPVAVAGRYRKVQYLVGPDIFPFWWAAMKVALTILAGIYVVYILLRIALAELRDGDEFPSLSMALFTTFGAVTLVAIAIEQLGLTKHLYRWRPRSLPSSGVKLKSRFDAVVEAGMAGIFLLWWFGVVKIQNWMPLPDTVSIKMGLIFSTLFWPITAYALIELSVSLLAVFGRSWVKTHAAASFVRYVCGSILFTMLLRAGHWITVSGYLPQPEAMITLDAGFNNGMRWGIVGAIALVLVLAAMEGRRFWMATQAEKVGSGS